VSSIHPGLSREETVDGVLVTRVSARTRIGRVFANYAYYRKRAARSADVVLEEVEGPQGPFFLRLFVRKPTVLLWHQRGKRIFEGAYGPFMGRVLSLLDYAYSGMYPRNLVVVPSQSSKRELSLLSRGQRIQVVHPALPDPDALPVSLRIHVPPRKCDGTYFITVNKIRRYKALDHSVRAFGFVAAEFPETKFVIGGVAEDDGYAKELADLGSAVAPGRVFVFPDLSKSEKEELVRGAYAFVLPSPLEGFSIATLEALSAGTPAIVSDGVPEELVGDGLNGLRFHFGNITELAELYRRILAHPELRARLSAGASDTAMDFSWDRSTDELEASLTQVVSSGTKSVGKGPS